MGSAVICLHKYWRTDFDRPYNPGMAGSNLSRSLIWSSFRPMLYCHVRKTSEELIPHIESCNIS